jgi:hypothetical protein
VQGGPEIAFRPRFADARHVRWNLVTGTPELSQAGEPHYWDLSAPGPSATLDGFDRDGRELTTDYYLNGATNETTGLQLQARATSSLLTAAGFPRMDAVENRNSVLLASTLQAYADEGVLRGAKHIETFQVSVRPNNVPRLGSYRPGDCAKIRIGKNPRMPPGTRTVRIVRVSFAATGDVTLGCASERVGAGYPVPSSNKSWLGDQMRSIAGRIDETNRGS